VSTAITHGHNPILKINQDQLQTAEVLQKENDLIEVLVEAPAGMNNLVLQRSATDIFVYTSPQKGQPMSFDETTNRSFPLTFTNGKLTVYVEWIEPRHGTADLHLVNVISPTQFLMLDSLKFHTFHSILVALGGKGSTPSYTLPKASNLNAATHDGIYSPAGELYRSGYDVYMYQSDGKSSEGVNNVEVDGTGAAYNEIVAAIKERAVDEVAIFGHSWGGGATYLISNALTNNAASIGTFSIKYTAYVDAAQFRVARLPVPAETRPPAGSAWHVNMYQRTDPTSTKGAPTVPLAPGKGQNIDVFTWDALAKHTTIDNLIQVKNKIANDVKTRVAR
jgi:hypothetical protein